MNVRHSKAHRGSDNLTPSSGEAGKVYSNTFVPVHTMKAYRGSRGIVPLILKIGASWCDQIHAPANLPSVKNPGLVGPRTDLDV